MTDILLATYNGQAYLGEQIDSILSQSNQDWQLIVRDDASDDNTLSIIKDYSIKYPVKIKLVVIVALEIGILLSVHETEK